MKKLIFAAAAAALIVAGAAGCEAPRDYDLLQDAIEHANAPEGFRPFSPEGFMRAYLEGMEWCDSCGEPCEVLHDGICTYCLYE